MLMALQADNLEAIRDANDIVTVIGGYVRLKKFGVQMAGLCPFHKEKSPSFYVHSVKQLYHCHGCGAGGDVFRFVEQIENLTFVDAKNMLAVRAGIPVATATKAERRVWADRSDERELIEHFRLVEHVPVDRAHVEFYARCAADPGYLSWLKDDLAHAYALCGVLVGIITIAQEHDGKMA